MTRHAQVRSSILHTCAVLALAAVAAGCPRDPPRPLHVAAAPDAGPDAGPGDGGPDDGGVVDAGMCPGATAVDAGPACTNATAAAANLPCNDDPAGVASAVRLMTAMTTDEKVTLMSGPAFNPNDQFDQADIPRLGIPGSKYMDGPRGVRWYNTDHGTTVYPVSECRAASWDPELERLIGKGMAQEMRDLGRHILNAPTINQVMHPRWGRAQESYGEDTYMLGEMGAALVKGVQYDPTVSDPNDPGQAIEDTYRVQACVKHLAANNIEDTRIFVNAVLDERTLREVYLPHFKKAVDAGAACVMAAYNRVNGFYSCSNQTLIGQILKNEWKYQGFVISDWFAAGQTQGSAEAGLDVEMPFSSGTFPSAFDSAYFYGPLLTAAVQSNAISESLVDEAALRILYKKVHFGLLTHSVSFHPENTLQDSTIALTLRAAREGIVLLKNGPATATSNVLPLDPNGTGQIAVVGRFANAQNTGDHGSSEAETQDASLVITPFQGIQALYGGAGQSVITYTAVAGHETAIAASKVVIVVTAYQYADLARTPAGEEGEWKDRVSLQLAQRDLDNINNAVALKATNPNLKIIVVEKSGGAVVVKPWIDKVDALIHAWYAGMSEGTALAEILFGLTNPSGKLVQSFPVNETDLPVFNNSSSGDVDYNYYHGYRWLDKQGIAPQYYFGYGLSYTTFAYSNLQVTPEVCDYGTLNVTVDVKNTGTVKGSEVVQLYVGYDNTKLPTGNPPSSAAGWGRPVRELKAFQRINDLAPGTTKTVTLTVNAADLGYWDTASQKFITEKIVHQLYVGPNENANDPNMQKATFTVVQ